MIALSLDKGRISRKVVPDMAVPSLYNVESLLIIEERWNAGEPGENPWGKVDNHRHTLFTPENTFVGTPVASYGLLNVGLQVMFYLLQLGLRRFQMANDLISCLVWFWKGTAW